MEPIITPAETDSFLRLESDAQRDFFIEQFWIVRDTDPRTARNEYEEEYRELLQEARNKFRYLSSDRAKILLIHGRPAETWDIRTCDQYFQPLDIWYYPYLEGIGSDVLFLFYLPRIGADYRLWIPMFGRDGIEDLRSLDAEHRGGGGMGFQRECTKGEIIGAAIGWGLSNRDRFTRIYERPEVDVEFAARTMRTTVILNPDAPVIDSKLEVEYPARRGTRTVVRLNTDIDPAEVNVKDLGGNLFYNIDLIGEVIRNGSLFENFRYRFDYPGEGVTSRIPLSVERFLRPGTYTVRLKIIDINGAGEGILESVLEVPEVKEEVELTADQRTSARKLDELQQQLFSGDVSLRILPPAEGILTGLLQIDTVVSGEGVDHVEFWLDDRKIMTKREPPYTLELDLGPVPLTRRLKVVGYDANDDLLAGDEIVLNTGIDPYRVHIESPRITARASGPMRMAVDVETPRGRSVASVELYVNEDRVATLYDRPFVHIVDVPEGLDFGYLRAVATLDGENGEKAEDVVFLNRPPNLTEIEVHLVELPATVLRNGRPVHDLPKEAFTIYDEGSPVEIAKFEYVRDVPLSIGLAVDSSASMEARMNETQTAAAGFLRSVLRPRDRAFLIGFSSVPVIATNFTSDQQELARSLASLRAEGPTALHDAIVYALYSFQGVGGQKALVVLSDGADTSSKFEYSQMLEYARRSALPVYVIGIGIPIVERDSRGKLAGLASATGGRAWFIEGIEEIESIYRDIERELRSQYILGFYPPDEVESGGPWRHVRVAVEGGEVRSIQGYYP
ncbi:MAG: VWA domain-containing protein [Acidobacteria bacterium]|nr:VWA domain-containing protein [Acidobacteriota bacterium]